RNPHELREASICIDSKNFYVLANVRLTHAARPAMPPIHVHLRGHEVAVTNRCHFVANFFNNAAEFVAKSKRRMNSRRGPAVPTVNVQVRAANRSGPHPHEYVGGSNCGNAYGFKLRATLRAHLA